MTVVQHSKYVEEIDFGLNLNKIPAFIDDKNKHVYCISDTRILVFNAKNGKRLNILNFKDTHLAVYANEQYCISITKFGVLLKWDLETNSVLRADNIISEELLFVYKILEGFYIVSKLKNLTNVYKLILDNNGEIKECNKIGHFSKMIKDRKHITICDDFAVIITGKINLEIVPFKSNIKADKYVCRNSFANLVKQNLLAFDSVCLINETLYASLNIGRLLFWKIFKEEFFNPKNMTFFHRHPSAIEFIVHKDTLYAGGGEATVNKWNLAATGIGRWQKPENTEKFDAPVNCLSLSNDGTLLVVQLEDNTIWILQTTSMNILCELQSMQWNTNYNWLPLIHDPTRPDLIVTGGRIGHLQWFDPTKWRTVAFFDVTNETTPSRDNVPYGYSYDWLNVYLVNISPTTIVTVETRRNRKEAQSFIKFFRRNPKANLADIVLEDTIEWSVKGTKIMSSNDNLSIGEAFASLQEEEIVFIDSTGMITVFIRDVNRSGRWLQDLSRTNQWMKTQVKTASKVRRDCFGAIHFNPASKTHNIVLWNLNDLTVYRVIDEIENPKMIEWAPLHKKDCEGVMLITTATYVIALDLIKQEFLWMTMKANISLFSSSNILCCYHTQKGNRAYSVNPLTGDIETEVSFLNPIHQAIVTTSGKDIKFIGKSKTNLHLLKIETDENEPDKDIASKKTPFTELIIQHQEREGEIKKLRTFKDISIKSRFDLPVYASAPLTRIAPEIIQECFIPRDEDY